MEIVQFRKVLVKLLRRMKKHSNKKIKEVQKLNLPILLSGSSALSLLFCPSVRRTESMLRSPKS